MYMYALPIVSILQLKLNTTLKVVVVANALEYMVESHLAVVACSLPRI